MFTPKLMIGTALIVLSALSLIAFPLLPNETLAEFKRKITFLMTLIIAWAVYTGSVITFVQMSVMRSGWFLAGMVLGTFFTFALGSLLLHISCSAAEDAPRIYRFDDE